VSVANLSSAAMRSAWRIPKFCTVVFAVWKLCGDEYLWSPCVCN